MKTPELLHSPTELRTMAKRLLIFAETLENEQISTGQCVQGKERRLVAIAKIEYQDRQQRTRYISADLLGEPAWDMMLDIFINRTCDQKLQTSELCLAANVPPSNALRWIKALDQAGLINILEPVHEHAVPYVELSEKGYHSMLDYLKFRDTMEV